MKISSVIILCLGLIGLLIPAGATAEPVVLLENAPQWNVGDSWKYRIDKKLERTITQGAGMLEITMRLDSVVSTLSYSVTGTATIDGEACYATRITGDQTITGTYNTAQLQEQMGGASINQTATIEGIEYRRVRDLAFVKVEMRSEGTIQLSGELGGIPAPFQSNSITVATPPIQVLRFPLVEGDSWNISSTLNTTSSGTSSESIITSFNYTCKVTGTQAVELKNGDTYDCIIISQEGTQTVQSQNSGINIEAIRGSLFFAPFIGNRVKDDAEGEELIEYVSTEKTGSQETTEMEQPSESQESTDVTHETETL